MIFGVDEAGKGSVLGPMVIGCVGSEDETVLTQKVIGLRDSKKLTKKRREILFEEITGSFPYNTVVLSALDIDTLRKAMTMNEIVANAHAKVAEIAADTVYFDACDVNENRYKTEMEILLNAKGKDVNVVAKHRADSLFPVVSAASIVAKVTRDRAIEELYSEYGDFGSGYPSDHFTIEFLGNWIKEHNNPPDIARWSWETVKNISKSCQQKSLMDF